MQIKNPTSEKLKMYYAALDARAAEQEFVGEYYLQLGSQVVCIKNYSTEFIPHIERQLTYILSKVRDTKSPIAATIVTFKEPNFETLPEKLDSHQCNPKTNLRLRVEMLYTKSRSFSLGVFDDAYSKHCPLINIDCEAGILSAYNPETNTYYYGVKNLESEEFIKQGHIFVQILNKILKTDTSALVHGAVVGLDDVGVLFCARGQRGKSTLAVLAMMEGFDYVSDDYLILDEEVGNGLTASPIYSIITLSPKMYGTLYDDLKGKFVSNNARKDKYVVNIAQYHNQFRKNYPVSLCMFPEIVSDSQPSIALCSNAERGRAITHLIHSTINQTGDKHDIATVKKIMRFVQGFDFYRINLCADIHANVQCLRGFLQEYGVRKKIA